jgi:hypothetical protein
MTDQELVNLYWATVARYNPAANHEAVIIAYARAALTREQEAQPPRTFVKWAKAEDYSLEGTTIKGRSYSTESTEHALRGWCAAIASEGEQEAQPAQDAPVDTIKHLPLFMRGYDAGMKDVKASYEAHYDREAQPTCPDCHGSGEGGVMEGRGPDTYEVAIQCPRCGGTGVWMEQEAQPAAQEPSDAKAYADKHGMAVTNDWMRGFDFAVNLAAQPALDSDGDPMKLCTVCGSPVRYGSRHSQCGAALEQAIRAAQPAAQEPSTEIQAALDTYARACRDAYLPSSPGVLNNLLAFWRAIDKIMKEHRA